MEATRPSQRPFFGENVARRELGGTAEAQKLPHGGRRIDHREPRLIQTARGIANPVRHASQPALLRQIFSHRADQGIKPDIAGQFWLALEYQAKRNDRQHPETFQ